MLWLEDVLCYVDKQVSDLKTHKAAISKWKFLSIELQVELSHGQKLR